jgi:hypothetical protein
MHFHILHILTAGAVGFIVFLFAMLGIMLYFLPTWIAFAKGTKARWWIAGANLLFGFSLIGWFLTLAWAWTSQKKSAADDFYWF